MCNEAKKNGHHIIHAGGGTYCCKRCGKPAAECAKEPCAKPAHKK